MIHLQVSEEQAETDYVKTSKFEEQIQKWETDYVKTSTFEELVQRVEVLEGSGT